MTDKTETHQEGEGWTEIVKVVVIVILLALFIRTFVVQAFKIPSESMLNTLLVGDHLLVNKLSYFFTDPERGDIIVFEYPKDRSTDFVKRIIGLPGDILEIKGITVYINGVAIEEPYAVWDPTPLSMGSRYRFGPVKVPENSYYMLGDNRNHSQDSRYWGALPKDHIHGNAFIIHWSWKGFSWGVRWNRITKLLG